MAIVEERRRHELHSRLRDVLDPEPAETLMSLLPSAEVATRDDVAGVRRDLAATEQVLTAKVDGVRSEIGGLRGEIGGLRSEVDAKLDALRHDQHAGVQTLRTDMANFRTEIQTEMQTFRTEMANFRADMERRLHSMTRSLFFGFATMVIGVGGLLARFL